jgi:hypothetical protein
MQYRKHIFAFNRCAIALALSAGLMTAQAQNPAATSTAAADQLFPNAKSGECYARIFIPPTYTTETQEVVKRAASQRIKVVPAKFETVTETVVVKAASKRLEVIPATYEWQEEEVVVRQASKRLVPVPATYENVTEKVLVKAGYTTWKKGASPAVIAAAGPGGTRVSASGDVLCLVEVPPVYKTITKRVEKTPASTIEKEIPAVTKTVRRQVMKTPPTTREVEIPAVMRKVRVTRLVEPAKEVRTEIPAQMQTVSNTKQVTDGRYEWRSILCETNATKDKIKEIQRALKSVGFDPGPIDGVIAQQTMRAVNAYQRDKSLPVDPYLNMETVRSLGVTL